VEDKKKKIFFPATKIDDETTRRETTRVTRCVALMFDNIGVFNKLSKKERE
jgi:hypothetical protein